MEIAVQSNVSNRVAANLYYQRLRRRGKLKQACYCLLILFGNMAVAAATSALAVLQFQPIVLISELHLSENNHTLHRATITAVIIFFILGLFNLIPQVILGDNMVQFVSRHVQKSILTYSCWICQFCQQKIYLIIHFANMLRFTNGKIYLWPYNKSHENRCLTTFKKILLLFGIFFSYFYMLAIIAGICGLIFNVLRMLMITSTFLICYSSYFSKLIIVTVPYLIGIKVKYQSYINKKRIIERAIRRSKENLNKMMDCMLKDLSLHDPNDEAQGNITIYVRMNQEILNDYDVREVEASFLFKSNDSKVKLEIGVDQRDSNSCIIIDKAEQRSADNENLENMCEVNIATLNITTSEIYWSNANNSLEQRIKIPNNSDGQIEWIARLNVGKKYWKILHKRMYSISRDVSFAIERNIQDHPKSILNFDADTHILQMKWMESEQNNQYKYNPTQSNFNDFVEVDVPEMLLDIKDCIHNELARLIKDNSEINQALETFRINISYLKTKDELTLTLPSSNDNYFYHGCNIDLVPVMTHIGNYLYQNWDIRAFRRQLYSNNLYYDVAPMGHTECIGIPKNLYDYICSDVTSLTFSFRAAVTEIIFGTILYIVLIAGVFAFTRVDSPVVFLSTLSNVPISLAVIVLIIGFINVRQCDEQTIKADILDALLTYKRGYRLFCTPLRKSLQSKHNQFNVVRRTNSHLPSPINDAEQQHLIP